MAEAFAQAVLQGAAQAELFNRILQSGSQLREGEGLCQIIEDAHFEGGAHIFERGITGNDDDAQVGPAGKQLFGNFIACDRAHFHVQKHNIGQTRLDGAEQRLRLTEGAHVVALVPQDIFDIHTEIVIVIEDCDIYECCRCQCFAHGSSPQVAAGRTTSSKAPPSGRFEAVMVPPCWVTMPSATVRPNPVPWASKRVLTKASNRLGRTWEGIPGPLSTTVQQTQFWPLLCMSLDSTVMMPPFDTASSALRSRFTNTWTSRSGLPMMAWVRFTLFWKVTRAAFSSMATKFQLSSISGARSTRPLSSFRTRAKSTRPSLILRNLCVTRSIRWRRSWVCSPCTVSSNFSMDPCNTARGVFNSCATLVLKSPRLTRRSCSSNLRKARARSSSWRRNCAMVALRERMI